jgi:Scaffold protein Nfu/NifU N terminal
MLFLARVQIVALSSAAALRVVESSSVGLSAGQGRDRGCTALGQLVWPTMGQPVAVVEKSSSNPGVVRFEANRTLTGQGHMHYRSRLDAHGSTPADVLARRLFDSGRVAGVHLFSNMITVDLEKGYTSEGLLDVVQDLYVYYVPGVVPPSADELMAGMEEPAAASGAVAGAAGGAELSEAAKRIPPLLLERSRAALAKWKATH